MRFVPPKLGPESFAGKVAVCLGATVTIPLCFLLTFGVCRELLERLANLGMVQLRGFEQTCLSIPDVLVSSGAAPAMVFGLSFLVGWKLAFGSADWRRFMLWTQWISLPTALVATLDTIDAISDVYRWISVFEGYRQYVTAMDAVFWTNVGITYAFGMSWMVFLVSFWWLKEDESERLLNQVRNDPLREKRGHRLHREKLVRILCGGSAHPGGTIIQLSFVPAGWVVVAFAIFFGAGAFRTPEHGISTRFSCAETVPKAEGELVIDGKTNVYVDGKLVVPAGGNMQPLRALIEQRARSHKQEIAFSVQADDDVRYQKLIDVLDAVRERGCRTVIYAGRNPSDSQVDQHRHP